MKSLLGQLYSKIKGAPEDLATESLCYILNESKTVRESLCKYLSSKLDKEFNSIFDFRTQESGENNERPDLVGFDNLNNEILIFEAKFWAGLTQNQPIAYLKRLIKNKCNGQKALVFICPDKRLSSLWSELIRICKDEEILVEKEIEEKQIKINDNVLMSIVSWKEILGILNQTLVADHSELVSDLHQLEGLCHTMDEQAFVPFTKEDFGIEKANRIISFYNLVDRVADELINKLYASKDKLKATPQYAGYDRYLKIRDYGISVRYNCWHWKQYSETPFWLSIKKSTETGWQYSKDVQESLMGYENAIPKMLFYDKKTKELLIPLFAKTDAAEDEIVKDMFNFIKGVFEILK